MYHIYLFSFISNFTAPDPMTLELAPVFIGALLLGGLIYCGILLWNRVKKIIPYIQKMWKFLKAIERLAEKGDEIINELARKGDEAIERLAGKGDETINELARKGDEAIERLAGKGEKAVIESARKGDEAIERLAGKGEKAASRLAERSKNFMARFEK